MSLPEVYEVMQRIDKCKSVPNKMYMRAEFEFCARGIELAGQLTSADKQRHSIPYGPIGKDVFVTEIEAPPVPTNQLLNIILTALGNREEALSLAKQLGEKIKVAVFKVPIAKQHLEKGEAYPYRLVALPLDSRYDPWATSLLEWWHDAGDHVVFDFHRQDNWEYITRKDKIFEGLHYRIKKYHYLRNGQVTEDLVPCLSHSRRFRCHAIRHVRTDQLIKTLKFDGFDIASFVGWAMSSCGRVAASPPQAGNYAELREAWPRYIHKLCVPFNYSAFLDNKNSRMEEKE